ncbi:hypothetical protein [Myroides sp. DW712]|uniref:hypothetical protein n=1 Tax=Myroides sp. DW712 TaxID=3389800 RepID=UPI00397C705F
MKKVCCIVVLCLGSILTSCSKNDDNKDTDPIFSLPYIPLKSLSEFSDNETYYYAGFKAGERNASMLSPTSTACNRDETLQFFYDDFEEIKYIKYYRTNRNCSGKETVVLSKNKLISEGILLTKIEELMGDFEPLPGDDDKGNIELEIGFQGEYLRIEDQMSHYNRTNPTDKVYLYFKKKY